MHIIWVVVGNENIMATESEFIEQNRLTHEDPIIYSKDFYRRFMKLTYSP